MRCMDDCLVAFCVFIMLFVFIIFVSLTKVNVLHMHNRSSVAAACTILTFHNKFVIFYNEICFFMIEILHNL